MKAIYIEKHGLPDALAVSEVPKPSPGPGEVLVKVEASGINPSDVASVEGKFPNAVLPRIVGRDFAGKIADGPADVLNAEVLGSGGDLGVTRNGTHAEFLAIPRTAIALRPKNLSAVQASAVGVPYIAAYSALVPIGQLKEGECVIISGAAGSVGQAAIQIAAARGARIVALIKDASERWVSHSGLVQAVAQSDQGDLNRVVRDLTGGKGANLALNAVGGAIFAPILESLAVGGRQVVISAAGGREASLDLMNLYRNQFAVLGLDTQKLDATKCADILNELAPLFESGKLKPPSVEAKFSLAQVKEAYGHVASHKPGKVVFVMN
jgi:NADPH:quinone reductase